MKVLILGLCLSLNTFAAVNSGQVKQALKNRKAGLTSRITHKRLERAFRYSRNKEPKKAAAELVKLLKQTENRKYEYGLVWQNLGFLMAGNGENKKAIKALENSLKLNVLPYAQTLGSLYTLSQLYFSINELEKAKTTLEEWFSYAEEPKPQAYMLMGMILGQNEEKEKALDYVNHAINKEKNAPEKWLQFALSLNHSLKKYKNAIKILAILTSEYPEKKIYWKQFYQTYLSLFQDEKALVVMEMSYKQGHMVEEKEILNMASLMIYLSMPHKAARVIEIEMEKGVIGKTSKNYELLSQAWYQSKEVSKAINALDKAGTKSNDGSLLAKKGYMQLEKDNWSDAIKSFRKSLAKGKLKNTSKVYFALGLAYYNDKDLSGALNSLIQAKKLDKDNESISTWIDQIKNKKMAMNEVKQDSSLSK